MKWLSPKKKKHSYLVRYERGHKLHHSASQTNWNRLLTTPRDKRERICSSDNRVYNEAFKTAKNKAYPAKRQSRGTATDGRLAGNMDSKQSRRQSH